MPVKNRCCGCREHQVENSAPYVSMLGSIGHVVFIVVTLVEEARNVDTDRRVHLPIC